jgi:CHAD domain-containing protein
MKAASAHTMRRSLPRSELLKKRLDALTRVLSALEEGDVRALHRARVASRRLRELVPVLQLDRGDARKLARRLRKVTSRLGVVRELDVLLLSIDELHVSRRVGRPALSRVGMAVSKDRDRARKHLAGHLLLREIRRLARKLDRVVEHLRLTEASASRAEAGAWRWAIEARVARRAARLSQAIQDAGAVYLPERLHVVRIALKKTRYAMELKNEVAGVRRHPDVRTLKRGQDLLGRMHDLQVLTERVRQMQASMPRPSLSEWREFDALLGSLEDDCRRLHARYMRLRDALTAIADSAGARANAAPLAGAARRVG